MTINQQIQKLLQRADKITDTEIRNAEKSLIKVYKNSLDNIKTDVAKLYERMGDDVSIATANQYNRLKNLEINIDELTKALAQVDIKETTSVIKTVYQHEYNYTYFAVESSVKTNLSFVSLNNDEIISAIFSDLSLIKWTDRTKQNIQVLNRNIKESITEGIVQGKSYQNVARSITEKYNVAINKSSKIVRTESHRVANQSRLKAKKRIERIAKKKDINTYKVWVAADDERTRKLHNRLDNQRADKDGKFKIDGIETDAPGLSGVASFDINCRCSLRIELDGISTSGNDNIPDNFDDYMKSK